jgi:hypothetical protein
MESDEQQQQLLEDAMNEATGVVQSEEEATNVTDPIQPNQEIQQQSNARFQGASWYNKMQEQDICIAGLGGIGSWTALLISRLNVNLLALYDNDKVSEINMSGQLFRHEYIGCSKVYACNQNIYTFTDMRRIQAFPNRYTRSSNFYPITICAFDNMEARKEAFYNWSNYIYKNKEIDASKCLFIDGRLSLEELQIFCMSGTDREYWKKYDGDYLFDGAEAVQAPCSAKQTTYMASMIASLIANLVVNFVDNQANNNFRSLPFYTEYKAATMNLKMEQ